MRESLSCVKSTLNLTLDHVSTTCVDEAAGVYAVRLKDLKDHHMCISHHSDKQIRVHFHGVPNGVYEVKCDTINANARGYGN